MLYIYLVERMDNGDYDQYLSFVCIAESELEARHTHPSGLNVWTTKGWVSKHTGDIDNSENIKDISSWTRPENVSVVRIGVADIGSVNGVVLAEFNAG
jgi:hypothetical protein